jgi:simple sugar transport system permease protein
MLISMGLAIGFRAGVWNIGAEGQFILGAVFATGIALMVGDRRSGPCPR